MSWLRRFRDSFAENRLNAEFDEEMHSHLEERASELEREGTPAAEARRQARLRFGNPLVQREAMRDARIIGWLVDLRRDLHFALRMLCRHPGMGLAAIGSLALAIGATCAVFTVLNALVLKPLPVHDPGSLVHLYVPLDAEGSATGAANEDDSFSYPLFLRMRERARDVADLFAAGLVNPQRVRFAGDDDSARANVQCISGAAFHLLGLQPASGRLLAAQDDIHPAGHAVAVLSFDFWQARFGKDPGIVGRTLDIDGRSFEILGVTPKGFSGIDVGTATDLWIPLTMWQPTEGLVSPDWRNFRVMGRMREGVPPARLAIRVQSAYADFLHERRARFFPDGNLPDQAKRYFSTHVEARSAPGGPSRLRGQFVDALHLLAGVTALVLLVACCNVANLLMARAVARRKEMAMRVSLGAGRGRLARQVLAESLLLGALASCAGLGLALGAAPTMVALMADSDHPVQLALDVDWRVFGFVLLTCLVVTLICGAAPALRAFRTQPGTDLQGTSDRVTAAWGNQLLVSAQVGISFVLVGACILFLATLRNLLGVDAGFSSEHLVLTEVHTGAADEDGDRVQGALEDLRLRLRDSPGIEACAYSAWGLFSGNRRTAFFALPDEPGTGVETIQLGVSPGFFEAMGTRLLRGRDFMSGEDQGDARPILVNASVARRFFGTEEAIGRLLQMGLKEAGPRFRIIGVVEDAKYRSMRDAAPPMVYTLQTGARRVTFAIRTTGGLAGVADRLKNAARQADAGFRVGPIVTQAEAVGRTLVQERLLARLSVLFAVLGTVLASIGVYGVLAYFVVRRRREIGIRAALGASRPALARTVLAHLAPAFLLGILAGAAATHNLARFAESQVFGIEPRAPMTFVLAGAILAVVAILAALLPTIRAMKIDPAISLRAD